MTTKSIARAHRLKLMQDLIDAAAALSDAWDEELDEGYPVELPSFDEHVGELCQWRDDQREIAQDADALEKRIARDQARDDEDDEPDLPGESCADCCPTVGPAQ